MPYPEHLVAPMRAELTRLGIDELKKIADVDAFFEAAADTTALLVVNSVCGCAAAMARPGVALALQRQPRPQFLGTVFAGQELEATGRAREHLAGVPPSSPFIALFDHGDPVFILERRHIEGRAAGAIASDLVQAFERFCGNGAAGSNGEEAADAAAPVADELPSTFRSLL